MERTLAYGQRAQCHVFHRGEHTRQPGDRQGVGHLETVEDVSVRPGCRREPHGRGVSTVSDCASIQLAPERPLITDTETAKFVNELMLGTNDRLIASLEKAKL